MFGFGSVIRRTVHREAGGGVCAPAQRAEESSSKSAPGGVAFLRKHVSSYAVVVPVLLGLVLLTVLTAAALKGYRLASKRVGGTALVNASGLSRDIDFGRRSEPLRIEPNVPEVSLDRDWESIDRLTERVWLRRGDPFAPILHALRTFESSCRSPDPDRPTWADLRLVVLDCSSNQDWYDGRVPLVQTRYGVRHVTSGSDRASQAHVDQCLSILAELGVSLEDTIRTPVGPVKVMVVLDDAIANFNLSGELEWSAVALALYLPVRPSECQLTQVLS